MTFHVQKYNSVQCKLMGGHKKIFICDQTLCKKCKVVKRNQSILSVNGRPHFHEAMSGWLMRQGDWR